MTDPQMPSYRYLLLPTLQALDTLGGSGTKDEVDGEVIFGLALTDEQLGLEYPPDAKAKGWNLPPTATRRDCRTRSS